MERAGWRVGASKCGWPFASLRGFGSVVILLAREGEEAAVRGRLGQSMVVAIVAEACSVLVRWSDRAFFFVIRRRAFGHDRAARAAHRTSR